MAGLPIVIGSGMSSGAQLAWVLLWLVVVTILVAALVVLALSRWGRSKPVRICAVLSLLMHVLLAGYAATIQILAAPLAPAGPEGIEIALIDEGDKLETAGAEPQPWDQPTAEARLPESVAELPKALAEPDNELARVESAVSTATAPPLLAMPQASPAPQPATPNASEPEPPSLPLTAVEAARIPALLDAPAPQRQQPAAVGPTLAGPAQMESPAAQMDVPTSPPRDTAALVGDLPPLPESAALPLGISGEPTPPTAALLGQLAPAPPVAAEIALDGHRDDNQPTPPNTSSGATSAPKVASIPEPYRARVESDRAERAARRGGSPEAEAAVQAGLRWLAAAQSDDGRWEAALYGAGRERRIGGTDRQGAGATADSAVTGLALLAFLGSGHTHTSGKYRDNVRRGLDYLLSIQRSNGSLAGNARIYEAMYCHGMAAFALSEAAAMTRDERLKPAVNRAVTFIVASQHPATGGWRYQPGDPGDTSQLGWQIMALRSAELAGTPIPERTREGIHRFLASVASGWHGGLASYRSGERATRTMTAEALASRQFMRLAGQQDSMEAADYIIQELPGQGEVNLYYWYYSTLAMYQLQDEHWEQWNQALQKSLIAAQHKEGDQAGSWDHDVVWGSYGGRGYTTALSTLCLEVYYRYLPIYAARAVPNRTVR